MIGHSAGADAAYDMAAADPRIKSFIAYSITAGSSGSPSAVPTVPGMVMAGTTDGIIPLAASRAGYRGMNHPKYLVTIKGAGHLVFSDIWAFMGRDKGDDPVGGAGRPACPARWEPQTAIRSIRPRSSRR